MLATQSAVVLEQALFASVRSGENEGYQVAAMSDGIDKPTHRALAAWGPSHDSLQSCASASGSINFHRLSDGRCCLTLTRATTGEYSGRGANVETWMLIAGQEALSMFGSHPLRLLDAALMDGWTTKEANRPVPLQGRARPVNLEAVAAACRVLPPEALAAMVERTTENEPIGIVTSQHQRLIIDALFSLLPFEQRQDVSFTTGLLPSVNRAFRLHLLMADAEVTAQFARTTGGELLIPSQTARPHTEQGKELAALLAAQRWCEIRRRVLALVP
jgi:hypothetical protein